MSGAVPFTKTKLPVEVWERVIDFCAEYAYIARAAPILRSCALTCRSWTLRSHYHLFYYITIKSEKSLTRFANVLRTSPQRAEYVRYLQAGSIPNPDRPLANRYPTLLPLKLAFKLPNLKALHLQCYPHDARDVLKLAVLKTVTQLTLTGCVFAKFNDFVRLVQAFGNLSELRLRTASDTISPSSYNPETLRTPTAKQVKLTMLTLHVSLIPKTFLTNFVNWILTTPTTTSITSLVIVSASPTWFNLPDHMNPVEALIAGLGPQLRSFSLRVENAAFRPVERST